MKKNEESLRDYGHHQGTNVHVKGFPEKERVKEPENLLKQIMAENFPSLKKEMDIQIQKFKSTN